ncbi:hypothetical protein GF362_04990 [Candidatus Dojkabacteria bacterium]|nr:hypothetical protein [Candidatus Dojkabacteria bacterium]
MNENTVKELVEIVNNFNSNPWEALSAFVQVKIIHDQLSESESRPSYFQMLESFVQMWDQKLFSFREYGNKQQKNYVGFFEELYNDWQNPMRKPEELGDRIIENIEEKAKEGKEKYEVIPEAGPSTKPGSPSETQEKEQKKHIISNFDYDGANIIINYQDGHQEFLVPQHLSGDNASAFLYAYSLYNSKLLQNPELPGAQEQIQRIQSLYSEEEIQAFQQRARELITDIEELTEEELDISEKSEDQKQLEEEQKLMEDELTLLQNQLDSATSEAEQQRLAQEIQAKRNNIEEIQSQIQNEEQTKRLDAFSHIAPEKRLEVITNMQQEKIIQEREDRFDRQSAKKTVKDALMGRTQEPPLIQQGRSGPTDPETILRLYKHLDPKYYHLLPEEQQEILRKQHQRYGAPKGEIRELFEYKTKKAINTRVEKVKDRVKRTKVWNKLQDIKAAGQLVTYSVTEWVNDKIDMVKDGVQQIGAVRKITSGINSIKNTIGTVRTGVGTTWNNIKMSGPVQFGVKSFNLGKKIVGAGQHIFRGARTTGLLGAGSGALFAATMFGPESLLAGAAIGAGVGTVTGTAKSVLNSAYNLDLSSFSPNDFSAFNGWNSTKVKIALNNPQNLYRAMNGQVTDYADDIARQTGVLRDMDNIDLSSIRRFRHLQNGLQALDWAGGGFMLGTILSGGNPLVGLAVGAGAGGFKFLTSTVADDLILKLVQADSKLLHLLKFPGTSVLGILHGADTISRQVNLIQKKGWGAFWEDQGEAVLLGIPGTKGLTNALGAVGLATSAGQLTEWIAGFSSRVAALPTPWKLAPMIVPAIYVAGGMILGYQVTMGGLIVATGIGIAATAVAAIVGGGTLGLGAAVAYVGTTTVLAGLDRILGLSNKLDELIEKWNVNIIVNITNLLGIVRIFKALKDLLDSTIESLEDYARLVPSIAITFLTTLTIFGQMSENMAEYADEIREREEDSGGFYLENEDSFAMQYTIPPLTIDCSKLQTNEINSQVDFFVTDVIAIDREGEITQNIKGQKDGQEIIYKNLASINPQINVNHKIQKNYPIGTCR